MDSLPAPLHTGAQLLTSLAVGLLLGLQRERVASAKAGLRTFALVALFGTVNGLIADKLGSAWIVVIGLLLVGAMIITVYHEQDDPSGDSGTTTVIALLLCYCLGAMIWYDLHQLAVALAIIITLLLHFKTELHGISARLTPQDIASVLQFAVLTFIVLPLLPDRGYGPYGAINPQHVWLMVVLVSGVSLAGYLALRFAGGERSALLTGVLGGLVSSTATTLVYARRARDEAVGLELSSSVIVIANIVLLLRLALIVGIAHAPVLAQLAPALSGGVLCGTLAVLAANRGAPARAGSVAPAFANPTQLKVALGFGLLYALVLLVAAWLSAAIGSVGLYAIAFASGLTDVDAITLSSVQLAKLGSVTIAQSTLAIVIAVVANTTLKTGIVIAVGGGALARRCVAPLAATVGGALLGLAVSRAL